ncbi:hypothetical protein ACFE04_011183 [Oxalis oulophora]
MCPPPPPPLIGASHATTIPLRRFFVADSKITSLHNPLNHITTQHHNITIFWRSEAIFGCLDGIVRTSVGYAGGSKANPEYRSLGDHAESVKSRRDQQAANSLTVNPLEEEDIHTVFLKDPYMAARVKERFKGSDKLKVLQENFVKSHLRSHMSSLYENMSPSNTKPRLAKVVANIPFNISTDVVKQLLPMGDIFSEIVLLLQYICRNVKVSFAAYKRGITGAPLNCLVYVDLYQIHWPDHYVPLFGEIEYDPTRQFSSVSMEEQLDTLSRAVHAGKIRYIGLSNETPLLETPLLPLWHAWLQKPKIEIFYLSSYPSWTITRSNKPPPPPPPP